VFLLLIILLASCTTSSPRNRGSLSGAMDKSRDDYEEERRVPDDEDDDWFDDEEEPESGESGNGDSPSDDFSPSPAGSQTMMVLVRGGSGFRGGPYFFPRFNGELLIGDSLGLKYWEIYLFGGFNHLTTNPSHMIYKSIKSDTYTLNAGLEGRFYPLPELPFFSPYVMGRIGGVILFWQFENPLTAGFDTISTDSLGGLLLGVGAGVDFIHTQDFKLGLSVIPETYLFGEETSQGFANDIFSTQGIVRWALEGGIRF